MRFQLPFLPVILAVCCIAAKRHKQSATASALLHEAELRFFLISPHPPRAVCNNICAFLCSLFCVSVCASLLLLCLCGIDWFVRQSVVGSASRCADRGSPAKRTKRDEAADRDRLVSVFPFQPSPAFRGSATHRPSRSPRRTAATWRHQTSPQADRRVRADSTAAHRNATHSTALAVAWSPSRPFGQPAKPRCSSGLPLARRRPSEPRPSLFASAIPAPLHGQGADARE